MIALSLVALSAVVVACQSSLGDSTNGAMAGTIDFQFQNAPSVTAVEWITRLTEKPVIVSLKLSGSITYRSAHKLTHDEAIQALSGALESNGWYLVSVNGLYYRLVTVSETNNVTDTPHIEIEIAGDRAIVDGKSIGYEDLNNTIVPLVTAETEVWVSAPRKSYESDRFWRTVSDLCKLKVRKIYSAYLPSAK
jgi:type II secretion system GspD-like secretin